MRLDDAASFICWTLVYAVAGIIDHRPVWGKLRRRWLVGTASPISNAPARSPLSQNHLLPLSLSLPLRGPLTAPLLSQLSFFINTSPKVAHFPPELRRSLLFDLGSLRYSHDNLNIITTTLRTVRDRSPWISALFFSKASRTFTCWLEPCRTTSTHARQLQRPRGALLGGTVLSQRAQKPFGREVNNTFEAQHEDDLRSRILHGKPRLDSLSEAW